MSLAELSIKRPIFITCVIVLMIVVGILSYKKMPVDQFPDVTFPIVFAEIQYPGASPADVEKQISKTVEDEVSSLSGLETISSYNYDSVAVIVIKFKLGTDIKEAEQQVRNRIQNVRNKLPNDAKEPMIRRFDPADQPIVTMAINSDLKPDELYDVANEKVKPVLERIQDVGLVRIVGGQRKEVRVIVDQNKLYEHRLSMLQVSKRIEDTSKDIPIGKFETSKDETVLRAVGEFKDLDELRNVAVNFLGSDRSVKLSEVASVEEGLEKAKRFSSINGQGALFLQVYKQSGANTVAVAERVKKQISAINTLLEERKISAKAVLIRDASVPVALNVLDVKESIFLGIILCIIVVFFFLGSARSTFITGLALPNSLLGGFVIMFIMGFTINIMTLLALSLAVGLLIDDAIVVRENIFRHLEMGKKPIQAAIEGTKEVSLAVIATTLVVIAVFGPVAFVPGIVGQFFKQFGLTVVFTMLISLFDAFTVAPMLSAYMATDVHAQRKGFIGRLLDIFNSWQKKLENKYEDTLKITLQKKKTVLGLSALLMVVSLVMLASPVISKTFLPPNDIGEFSVSLEMPVGSSLEKTHEFAKKLEQIIKEIPQVNLVSMTVGSSSYESNKADFYVQLVEKKFRKRLTTSDVKEVLRSKIKDLQKEAIIAVTDVDISGGGQKPLNLYLVGDNLDELAKYALALQKKVAEIPGLIDVDTNFRAGNPEYHVVFDRDKSEALGVSTVTAGAELRNRTEGSVPAVYRRDGIDYDIRVMFPDEQKDLMKKFSTTFVPNQNQNMVPLSRVAKAEKKVGYSQINRQNKGRFIALTANLGANGQLGDATKRINQLLENDLKPPAGITYRYEGQAQDFIDLMTNMLIALGMGVLLIYLVLASLYESFITPFTILLALPLAICGAVVALFIFRLSINIFSIIGLIMLMGVVAKNSILLVDYTKQLVAEGMEESEALIKAGTTRLRPILMTSLALIAGTMPIAIGVTALGTQRQSMGVAIIGGVLSSTILTLVVVPAAYGYIENFRKWSTARLQKLRGVQS